MSWSQLAVSGRCTRAEAHCEDRVYEAFLFEAVMQSPLINSDHLLSVPPTG